MAIQYVGTSASPIATNGGAPGACSPAAATRVGDLMVFYHYSRATGGDETVSLSGWTQIFNSVTASQGLVACWYKFRAVGETSYTATITNHTSGTSGETVLEWIETFRFVDPVSPIGSSTAALSTWASSTTIGAISAPATATLPHGDAVIVFGGRFENVTAQTTLTGDSLTWAPLTRVDSSLGLDAGAVTQMGANASRASQTITAKSITSTGTAGAGAGRMFVIKGVGTPDPIGPGVMPIDR